MCCTYKGVKLVGSVCRVGCIHTQTNPPTLRLRDTYRCISKQTCTEITLVRCWIGKDAPQVKINRGSSFTAAPVQLRQRPPPGAISPRPSPASAGCASPRIRFSPVKIPSAAGSNLQRSAARKARQWPTWSTMVQEGGWAGILHGCRLHPCHTSPSIAIAIITCIPASSPLLIPICFLSTSSASISAPSLALHTAAAAAPLPAPRSRPGPRNRRSHCSGVAGAGSPRLLPCRGQGRMLSGEGRVRRIHLPGAAAASAPSPGRCRPPARRRWGRASAPPPPRGGGLRCRAGVCGRRRPATADATAAAAPRGRSHGNAAVEGARGRRPVAELRQRLSYPSGPAPAVGRGNGGPPRAGAAPAERAPQGGDATRRAAPSRRGERFCGRRRVNLPAERQEALPKERAVRRAGPEAADLYGKASFNVPHQS